MKTASVSQAKNQLSKLLAIVRGGNSVLILDRGRPVARLEPVQAGGADQALDPLADLVRQGLVSSPGCPLPRDFFTRPRPRPRASIVQALIEERQSGR